MGLENHFNIRRDKVMKAIQIAFVLVVVTVVSMPLMAQESNVSQFEHLKEPKISIQKNQKMLVVEAKGDPNVVGGEAFGLLFRLYYSMPETPKGPMQAAPRARWPISVDAPKSTWIGAYALPVPEAITELPQHEVQEGLKASLTIWEYGKVAEILYIGPYDREEPTIKRLVDFIKGQGYVIVGDHEEEYIKGPSMYGKEDPEKYVTIIRYRVKKVNEP
jgi:hypothetical protein